MATITIQDLNLSKTLDRQAMAKLSGGGHITYPGSGDSYGSWSFVTQGTGNHGLLHSKHQRAPAKIDR